MGDVSGKAAPAALYAALISGIMRAASSQALSPAAMLKQLNDSLQERKMDAQYVTMVFAVWNDEKQTLQIANAGAVQPLFCRAGQVETVQAEGFPLGMFKDVTYEEFTLSTRPGDAIIFFSDGIVDAVNENEEMFGDGAADRDGQQPTQQHGRGDGGGDLPGTLRLPGRRRALRRRNRRRAEGSDPGPGLG